MTKIGKKRKGYMREYGELPDSIVARRSRHLLRSYGISLMAYNLLLCLQRHVCAICKKKQRNGDSLAVDHDHSTGRIRGLLCHGCNRSLGHLPDLSAAQAYVSAPQL